MVLKRHRSGGEGASNRRSSMRFSRTASEGSSTLPRRTVPSIARAQGAAPSARVDSLLGSPVERPIAPGGLAWEASDLPTPSAPSIVLPERWDEEPSAPIPCRGLSEIESAIARRRVTDISRGWWSGPDLASAARACSKRVGSYGASSHSCMPWSIWIPLRGLGIFTERGRPSPARGGPRWKPPLVSDLTGFFETNLRSLPRR
jgi:hypothetical protein